MTRRERVITALNHREPDRVPNDLGGTIVSGMHVDAYRTLADALGEEVPEPDVFDQVQQLAGLDEAMRQRLDVDCVPLMARPPRAWKLFVEEHDDAYTYVDQWGTTLRMPKRGGHYFDYWRFPLETERDIAGYAWPDPEDPGRTEGLREEALRLHGGTDYAICGSPLFGGGILEQATRIMGFERFLHLLARNSQAAEWIMATITELYCQAAERFLDQVGDLIHVITYWDDVATQDSLLISPGMYRSLLKPLQKRLFDTFRCCSDAKIFYHTDGAIIPLIPDLVEIGVQILQPVQVGARGMGDTRALKREFGEDLVFWGASCDTQGVLPFGTPDDVREETRRRIEDLKPGGGFVFSPIHNLQPGVPPENILAMYETFHALRDYR